ncbi:hypothetical protein F5884DRAFT_813904 [Xylogone sp. PMI_703]|nr:hypothetical protein F5884DRAFT_813904 [Xylogone sp. PMI_703]
MKPNGAAVHSFESQTLLPTSNEDELIDSSHPYYHNNMNVSDPALDEWSRYLNFDVTDTVPTDNGIQTISEVINITPQIELALGDAPTRPATLKPTQDFPNIVRPPYPEGVKPLEGSTANGPKDLFRIQNHIHRWMPTSLHEGKDPYVGTKKFEGVPEGSGRTLTGHRGSTGMDAGGNEQEAKLSRIAVLRALEIIGVKPIEG